MDRGTRHHRGKEIEKNLVDSLRSCGADLETSADLDHNRKIDFLLRLDGGRVGVQVSLRGGAIKARAAKICALDVVPRFIYLRIVEEFFDCPDKEDGRDLHRLIKGIVSEYADCKALMIDLDRDGLEVLDLERGKELLNSKRCS